MNIGDKVTYQSFGKLEHGIVKSLSDAEHVFVVYHCGGEWERYFDYTAARTCIADLIPGWVAPQKNSGAGENIAQQANVDN